MTVCERGMSFSITINVHPHSEAGEAVPRAGGRGLFLSSFFFLRVILYSGWWVKKHLPKPAGERERYKGREGEKHNL